MRMRVLVARRHGGARGLLVSMLVVAVAVGAAACGGDERSSNPSDDRAPTVATAPASPTAESSGPTEPTTSAPTTSAPTTQEMTLYPAQLEERDGDTTLLHVEEEAIVDGELRVPVQGVDHVWMLGRIGRDYLVTSADDSFEEYSVLLVRRDGAQQVLQRFGDSTTATASADGRRLALTRMVKPKSTRIRVVKTLSGALVRQRTFASYGAEVSDYGLRRMVVTGINGRTYWWDPQANQLSLIVARPGVAHIEADRMVVLVPDPDAQYDVCQRTVRLRRPSEVIWRSCEDIPLEFSPDVSMMIAIDIRSDGIGPAVVDVRRGDGELVQSYRAPMWFGFTRLESNTDLLLQPVGKKYLAAVRCTLGDRCERASGLYEAPATYDPPETMRWSFPE